MMNKTNKENIKEQIKQLMSLLDKMSEEERKDEEVKEEAIKSLPTLHYTCKIRKDIFESFPEVPEEVSLQSLEFGEEKGWFNSIKSLTGIFLRCVSTEPYFIYAGYGCKMNMFSNIRYPNSKKFVVVSKDCIHRKKNSVFSACIGTTWMISIRPSESLLAAGLYRDKNRIVFKHPYTGELVDYIDLLVKAYCNKENLDYNNVKKISFDGPADLDTLVIDEYDTERDFIVC